MPTRRTNPRQSGDRVCHTSCMYPARHAIGPIRPDFWKNNQFFRPYIRPPPRLLQKYSKMRTGASIIFGFLALSCRFSRSPRKMMQNGGVESSGASLWPEFRAPVSPRDPSAPSIASGGGGVDGMKSLSIRGGQRHLRKKLKIFRLFNSPGPVLVKN